MPRAFVCSCSCTGRFCTIHFWNHKQCTWNMCLTCSCCFSRFTPAQAELEAQRIMAAEEMQRARTTAAEQVRRVAFGGVAHAQPATQDNTVQTFA